MIRVIGNAIETMNVDTYHAIKNKKYKLFIQYTHFMVHYSEENIHDSIEYEFIMQK